MKTISTLIFDFGDVFINLDKAGTIERTKEALGFDIITEKQSIANEAIFKTNDSYEKGLISTNEFVNFYTNLVEGITQEEIISIWNSLLRDFPKHRLAFIKKLAKETNYKCILLSNTNELHINWIKEHVSFYEEFKSCFDSFYLSHEIHMRKPDVEIFDFVLNEHNVEASECLFIDDTLENTEAAKELGIHVWNIDEHTEDVVNLFEVKKELF